MTQMLPAGMPMCDLLQRDDAGSGAWWQDVAAQGTPLMIDLPETQQVLVMFLWRDLLGTASTSPYRRVWLNLTGVTDHHAGSAPYSLTRLPHTDVWYGQQVLPSVWQGSYCFIPCVDETLPSTPVAASDRLPALQQWWREQLPHAVFDPLNKRPAWLSARGHPASGLVLPWAAYSNAWQQQDTYPALTHAPERLQRRDWFSERLGTERAVWLFETGAREDATRPLVILLDGQFWARQMPIWSPIAHDTQRDRLPGAVYLLIDTLDSTHRRHEMICNTAFWAAFIEELLPMAHQWAAFSDDPARTVVAGQSLAGLAAMFAGMQWPDRFGKVLSQSGSYWCLDSHQWSDFITRAHSLSLFIQAGTHEPRILASHVPLLRALEKTPHHVTYQVVEGGHDVMWWREGLLEGLHTLLSHEALSV